jgi:hypothetical protein
MLGSPSLSAVFSSAIGTGVLHGPSTTGASGAGSAPSIGGVTPSQIRVARLHVWPSGQVSFAEHATPVAALGA